MLAGNTLQCVGCGDHFTFTVIHSNLHFWIQCGPRQVYIHNKYFLRLMLYLCVYRNSVDDLTIYIGINMIYWCSMANGVLKKTGCLSKFFTFHPLYFPSGKCGPQYFPIPLITHFNVLDVLSQRRLDLHTHKFQTSSTSLQIGKKNYLLWVLVPECFRNGYKMWF